MYLGCAMCIYPRTFGTLARFCASVNSHMFPAWAGNKKKHLERSGTTVRFDFLVNARVFL